MKRPDIQKMLRYVGGFSAAVGFHNYYLSMTQPTPSDQIANSNKGFEEMRNLLNETKVYYENNRQMQSQLKEFMINTDIRSVDNLLNKIKTGEKINTQTDPDFKKLEVFANKIKEWQNTVGFEDGLLSEEQITSNMNNAAASFYKNKGGSSNSLDSVDFLYNNNLIAEITDYMKSYNDWVSGLEIEQIVFVINISVLFTVFFSITTLLTIFYSDWLITKFNIEKKFPRIGKIIVLRRKIQNYSFFINSLIIFALIIPAFVVNVHALIASFSN